MLQIPDQKVPLEPDESGVLHIAGTRVTLECVASMFDEGASPEEITEEYDSLTLGDVYAVLTYCLRNSEDVRSYLSAGEAESDGAAERMDAQFPRSLREKLERARANRG